MTKIYRRADGRWTAQVELPRGPDGKRRRKTFYGTTKRAVNDQVSAQVAIGTGGTAQESKLKMRDFLRVWLDSNANWSDATRVGRSDTVRLYLAPNIGGIQLGKLTEHDIEWLYRELPKQGHSIATMDKASQSLTQSLNFAVKRRWIRENPHATVARPIWRTPKQFILTSPQLRQLLEAASKHRLSALFTLVAGCGLRQQEAFGLQWGDADLDTDRPTLRIERALKEIKGRTKIGPPKNEASRRTLTLPQTVAGALRAHRRLMADEGHLDKSMFCTIKGRWLTKANFHRYVWNPLRHEAGPFPQLTFHGLRHTCASLLIADNVPITVVSRLLGHENVTITLKTYAHLLPHQLGLAADKMDEILSFGSQSGSHTSAEAGSIKATLGMPQPRKHCRSKDLGHEPSTTHSTSNRAVQTARPNARIGGRERVRART